MDETVIEKHMEETIGLLKQALAESKKLGKRERALLTLVEDLTSRVIALEKRVNVDDLG